MYNAFFVRTNGKLTAFPFDELLFITAKNNYCEIVTTKKKAFVYVTLSCLQEKLPENLFCRVHRSHIIALKRIDSFDHNHIEIGGKSLPMSKSGFEAVTRRVLIICSALDEKQQTDSETMNSNECLKKVRKLKKREN